MELHKAIEEYIKLPASNTLDERIFFNILKDYHAFEQNIAMQTIVRSFISKGYLRDILYGKEWQLKSRQHLIGNMGFQNSLVDLVISEFELGFKEYHPIYSEEQTSYTIQDMSPEAEMQFKRYDKPKKESTHSKKPDSFNLSVNDIVMVKNGTARIIEILDDYISVKYFKHGVVDTRNIYYDESIEYIITPDKNIFLKSDSGRYFYICQSVIESENAKFIGTYADRICKTILMPYFIHKNGFVSCTEEEFLANCKDRPAFIEFQMNNK